MDKEKHIEEIENYKSTNFYIDWRQVKCNDGYYEYNPKMTIGMNNIQTIKIYSSECSPSFTYIINKYYEHLPHLIEWHIDENFNVVLSDEELFKNAIPNLIRRIEKGQIEGDIIISTKNNKYSLQEWDYLIEQKISEQNISDIDPIIFTTDYILNWEHLKCIKGYFVFIPIIDGIFVKTLNIKCNKCKKGWNKLITKYKSQLPTIHFKVNTNFEVEISNIELIISSFRKFKKQEEEEELKNMSASELKDWKLRKKGIDPSLFTKTFTINWADVYFCKNYYIFDPNHNNSISKHHIERLYINDIRSRDSFNFIKKYLMEHMPIIRYQISENFTIKLLDIYKPLLEIAINFLIKEQEKYDIGVGKIAEVTGRTFKLEKLPFKSAMSKAANMKPEDFKKYKSQFIDYLIFKQHKQYKVVPISESITHSNTTIEEAAFIFTTTDLDNNILLIVENINSDRSTIIFKVYLNQYEDALQAIFNFMQSDIMNKRSSIREKNMLFSDCGIIEYWSCNHDSFDDWRKRIEKHTNNLNMGNDINIDMETTEEKEEIDLSFIFDDNFINTPIDDGGQLDFYKNREELAQGAINNMEALIELYSNHPYAIECSKRLGKELNELKQYINVFHKLIFYFEYSKYLPKDEDTDTLLNEKIHLLDKVIDKNLYKEINNYLDIHSIDRNNIDAYSKAVHDVTTNHSRTVYKNGFEEELLKYIDEGRKVFENIKTLIENHPYTTKEDISNEEIEKTKHIYINKTDEIADKINSFIEDL